MAITAIAEPRGKKNNFSLNLQITPQELSWFLYLVDACVHSAFLQNILSMPKCNSNIQKKWCQSYFYRLKRYLCSQPRSHFSSCVGRMRMAFPQKQHPLASQAAERGQLQLDLRNKPDEPELPVSVGSVTVISMLYFIFCCTNCNRQK